MQSTYLSKATREQPWQLTDKPSEITWRTILFANLSRMLTCWVWAFGGNDGPTCSQDGTNQIWTRICIPMVFLFATGCWRVYDRIFSCKLWKEIAHIFKNFNPTNTIHIYPVSMNIWTMCSLNKKSPKTPTDDCELLGSLLQIYFNLYRFQSIVTYVFVKV